MTTHFTRRTFLGGLGAVLATAAAPAAAAQLVTSFFLGAPPTREERRRAVVVGSGFGGGVAALRLGQAGVDTLVLERGQWWPTGPTLDTFPRLLMPDQRASWFGTLPALPGFPASALLPSYAGYAGVMEAVVGDGISVICGAGVGGGSLVYDGQTWQPSPENFARVMPAGLDYEEMNRVFYPRAGTVLRASPPPDDVLAHPRYASTRQFLQAAQAAGFETRSMPIPYDWELLRKELRGEAKPWVTVGEYILGVNYGVKHALDETYVREALATGHVTVAALHVVKAIGTDAQGRYRIEAEHIDVYGRVLERVLVTADALFLGAGSVGTSRLLVRAKATGALPRLSGDVGQYWANNGDHVWSLGGVSQPTGTYQGGSGLVGALDWSSSDPVTLQVAPFPTPVETQSMTVFGMGIPTGHGGFDYDSRSDRVMLRWPSDGDARSQAAIGAGIRRLSTQTGGTPLDVGQAANFTAHPLGGAVLGKVCDLYGRVQGYRGLYVTDGALIPGSTGVVNPSFTIAALAERCLDTILRDDVGAVF